MNFFFSEYSKIDLLPFQRQYLHIPSHTFYTRESYSSSYSWSVLFIENVLRCLKTLINVSLWTRPDSRNGHHLLKSNRRNYSAQSNVLPYCVTGEKSLQYTISLVRKTHRRRL